MKNFSKRDCSILIGNCIDHFDSALYSFFAPVIGLLFFPQNDPLSSIILAYSVFATSIITRPLGVFLFGIIAKTYGPVVSLSYSLIGVAITTALIGMIPSYKTIGILAPILLIIIRSLGGIFSSGEVTIAELYILQDKEKKQALRSSYYYQMSSMTGIILASQVTTLIFSFNLINYWRVPFILSSIAAFSVYYLRNYKTQKTLINQKKLLKFYSIDSIKTLWKYKRILLKVAAVSTFSYTTYSVPFILMNTLIPLITSIQSSAMMKINTYLLILDMFLFPVIGNFIKKFNTKQVLISSCIILLITIIPVWYFLKNASLIYVSFVRIWIIILGVTFACPLNLWCNSLIKSNEKYLVIGMGSAFGTAIIGRMTPAIGLSLYYLTNNYILVGFYIMVITTLAMIIINFD